VNNACHGVVGISLSCTKTAVLCRSDVDLPGTLRGSRRGDPVQPPQPDIDRLSELRTLTARGGLAEIFDTVGVRRWALGRHQSSDVTFEYHRVFVKHYTCESLHNGFVVRDPSLGKVELKLVIRRASRSRGTVRLPSSAKAGSVEGRKNRQSQRTFRQLLPTERTQRGQDALAAAIHCGDRGICQQPGRSRGMTTDRKYGC
jgi:hypothetical protein